MPRHLFFAREPSLLFAESAAAASDGAATSESLSVDPPEWVHILPKPDKDGLIYSRDNRAKLVWMAEALPSAADAARLRPGQPLDVTLGSGS